MAAIFCGPLRLQQQRLDAMCVDHLFARGPGKDGEAPVLRCDERNGVVLILRELRR
jgi:hypothetical protein